MQQWGSGQASYWRQTRVPCQKPPWEPQPARPLQPPNALRNLAASPSAASAPQDARGTVQHGGGVVEVPKAAMQDEQPEAPKPETSRRS